MTVMLPRNLKGQHLKPIDLANVMSCNSWPSLSQTWKKFL